MSIIIRGMEMPEQGRVTLQIGADGAVYVVDKCEITAEKYEKNFEAVDLPPHGRLIDADALMNDGWTLHKQVMRMGGYAIHEMPLNNPNVPIVIPADNQGGDA